jgi:hypothetical protein
MLFVLQDNLLPFCSGNGGPELEGMQNLLLCVRRGQHAATGAYKLFAALAKNNALAAREKAMSLSLANRRTELASLLGEIKHKIFVEGNSGICSAERLDEFSWRIDVSFLSSKFLSEIVMLAENIVDAELYKKAAIHYKNHKKIKGVGNSMSIRGGGGSQIDVELNELLCAGVPVFAITDGDLSFPGSSRSVIAKRCDLLVNSSSNIGWHYSIPFRDIENVIPRNVLLDVADPSLGPDAYESINSLYEIKQADGSCPSAFLCFKKGCTLKYVFSCTNVEEKKYWISIAGRIKRSRPDQFSRCLEEGACMREFCECFLNKGFGESVLVQVRKWLDERSSHEAMRSFAAVDEWMNIGEMVFEASVAFKAEKV